MHEILKKILFFHSSCSSLSIIQLSVRTDKGKGLLSKDRTGMDRRGKELKTGKNVGTPFEEDP